MPQIKNFHGKIADWRHQLQINEKRTKVVIGLFFLLYISIGLIIDLFMTTNVYGIPLSHAFVALMSFSIFPLATTIMLGIAIVSLAISFKYYDKLILLGTDSREITPSNFQSIEEQQLYNVVEEMKVAAGLKYMPKVYIIEADYMNAFASGYSEKSALVAITRGLMQKLDRAELQAVMAHELSHIRHHDIKLTLTASLLSNIMIIAVDVLFRGILYGGGRSRGRGAGALIAVVVVLRFILPIITMLLLFYLSRTREYMADAGSVELMRDNEPMARALLKIDNDYKQNTKHYEKAYAQLTNEGSRRAAYIYDPATVGLKCRLSSTGAFSTHPAIADRLKALGFKPKKG